MDRLLVLGEWRFRRPGGSSATSLALPRWPGQDPKEKAFTILGIFYLDFAKAFNGYRKKLLIKKVKAKGLEPGVVNWIEDWLTDRTQRFCIQAEKKVRKLYSRFWRPPRDSPRPTLFTVYIDNLDVALDRLEPEVKLVKFADDTKLGKVIENRRPRQTLKNPRLPMRLGGKMGHELQLFKVQNHACWSTQSRL